MFQLNALVIIVIHTLTCPVSRTSYDSTVHASIRFPRFIADRNNDIYFSQHLMRWNVPMDIADKAKYAFQMNDDLWIINDEQIHKLNTNTLSMEDTNISPPVSIGAHVSCFNGNDNYLFVVSDHDELHIYDIQHKIWRHNGPMLQYLHDRHACVATDDMLYVISSADSNPAVTIVESVYIGDVEHIHNEKWHAMHQTFANIPFHGNIPMNIAGIEPHGINAMDVTSPLIVDGTLYSFGGYNELTPNITRNATYTGDSYINRSLSIDPLLNSPCNMSAIANMTNKSTFAGFVMCHFCDWCFCIIFCVNFLFCVFCRFTLQKIK